MIERCLGPVRYEISGAKTWINMKGYEGTISFELDEQNSTNPTNLEKRCIQRCSTCKEASNKVDNTDEDDKSAAMDQNDNEISQTDDKQNTKVLEGEFMTITGAVTSCISPKSPKGLSPSAHLGDGNLDLIVVDRTSRVNYLSYLIRTNMPSPNFSPFQLPFVQIYRVKEFSFQPNSSIATQKNASRKSHSVWNCDGELITNPSIRAKVYCQILPVFARGIE